MRIIILGAGVIGVTAAYYLQKDGHEVILVDRQKGAGLETSFANGGQISPSQSMPWASPETPKLILKWLGRHDAPLLYRMRIDPKLWSWSLQFLGNCSEEKFSNNTFKNLRLALYSRACLYEIRRHTNIEYDCLEGGILRIFRDSGKLNEAEKQASVLNDVGSYNQVLNTKEIYALEPACKLSPDKIIGGIYTPDDQSGDAFKFTNELTNYLKDRGVKFRFGEKVEQLNSNGDKIKSITTDKDSIEADAIVVSLGSYSGFLLKTLGIKIPVQPAKGYSLTVPIAGKNGAPSISITDEDHKIVFTRLGNRMRVAGTVEFAGFDNKINNKRAQSICKIAQSIFPDAGDYSKSEFWSGLRPLTPDGTPIIGSTPYKNLYLNTGHGSLGWTMCAGSGKIIADIINKRTTEINIEDIGLNRF